MPDLDLSPQLIAKASQLRARYVLRRLEALH
jgi:hypothetical protein